MASILIPSAYSQVVDKSGLITQPWYEYLSKLTSAAASGGTVTSVNASGGTTGLTFTGGPVTTAGTLTLGGTLGVANGGTGAASYTAGEILFGAGTSAISHSSDLTWSGTTGLLSRKGISSKGAANGTGTELFGLGASDAGTGATTNNTVIGKGASVTQTFITESVVIGANASTTGNLSVIIGSGTSSTGGNDVVIGRALTNSAQFAVIVGSSNSASNDANLALGSTNIAQHQDSGTLGWGAISQQAGELSWGARRNASGASSFRIFGCTSSAFTAGDMARINCTWIDATPATKKVRTILSTYDTAEREFMRADANGTGVDVFFNGTSYTFTPGLISSALVDISGASAGQIKFPATQNPSANANTLDDYEEGTWTPTDASGAALTLTINDATYTKVGRLVFARAYITYPITASGAGAAIGGFPFTIAKFGSAACDASGATSPVTVGQLNAGGTTMTLYTAATAAVTNAQLSAGFLIFSATYEV